MKPKICIVCDIPNWAFDIIAHRLQKALAEDFEIDIAYFDMREVGDQLFEFLEAHKEYDLLHFFWRKTLLEMEKPAFIQKVQQQYGDEKAYIKEISQKISTSVNDYMFINNDEEIEMCQNIFNEYAKKYFVISKPMLEAYERITGYKKPWGIVHDMYDNAIMTPTNLERFDKNDRPLVVGWVGNSKFSYGLDLKGFHTIIKPAIEELKEEGYQIEEYYADRNIQWRTHEEMPEYYSHIDVCLCASLTEGTPLPLLESMACGVPVIMTDVGVAREALGEKEQTFILGKRNNGENDNEIKQKLKESIMKVYQDRSILKELSQENLKSIEEYDGGKICEEFKKYFLACME